MSSASATTEAAAPGLRLLRDRPVWVTWALLAAATVVTTWLLTSESLDARWGLLATFAVAAWKVRLVLTDFIELRDAPLIGRLIFEGWAILVPAVLIVVAWPS